MKRRYISAGILLTGALMATGCGSEAKDTGAVEYAKITGLNNSIAASADMYSSPMTSDTGTESIPDSFVQEATGDETTMELEVTDDSDIYSKPGEEGAVVGTVAQGTIVQVIEIEDGAEWGKIVYKGRVAYIASQVLTEPAPEVTEAPTAKPTAKPKSKPKAKATAQPTPEPTQVPASDPGTAPVQPPVQDSGTTDPNPEPPSDSGTTDSTQEPPSDPGTDVTQPPETGADPTQEPPSDPGADATQPPASDPGTDLGEPSVSEPGTDLGGPPASE